MRILLIDDEKNIRMSLSRHFDLLGNTVSTAESGAGALEQVRLNSFDCVLLDLKLDDMDGIRVLQEIRQMDPYVPVILLTAHGTTRIAVEAIKKGAFDYFEKPVDEEKLWIAVQNAYQLFRLNREKSDVQRELDRKYRLIGSSMVMQQLQEQIELVAERNSRVLITGESGTGKELVGYAIHRKSSRREGPFVRVNCAAIPHELFESELFGHEKGAFTGAVQQRIGRFEQADHGTLFLDEIGEIPLSLQPKILRALQENEIQRVGGQKEIQVDVRVIAATNRKLEEEMQKGNFREDLYYRLNVFPIEVPPLREHRDDIPDLIRYFVEQLCEENNVKGVSISDEVIASLAAYEYPGNIRELRNLIERLLIVVRGNSIELPDVRRILPGRVHSKSTGSLLFSRLQDTEREILLKTLEEQRWRISKAARVLGLERSHLYKKMKKHGIKKPEA